MSSSSPARPPLLLRLKGNSTINTLVKTLRVNRLADWILARFPISKKTPGGLTYQMRSVASVVVAKEIFDSEDYLRPLQGEKIHRFVDLGCNVGYFPLLIAELTGSRDLEGLMLDGNRAVLDEAREHLQANGLRKVEAILGLAGFSRNQREASFFVSVGAHIASTATGKMNPEVPAAGPSVEVTVPCVDVEAAWVQKFGDVPVDLLKVDIEGMELELFQHSPELLARSQRLLFEWHKWQVSLDDCRTVLLAAGFEEPVIVSQDSQHGLAYARRRTN